MTRGVSFCSAASVEPDGFTPLHVGSVDQLQHLWKHSLLGPPGPSSEAVSFLPDKQRWQPRWGGSCTRLLGRSTRDHTRINLRRWMHIVRSWLFTACSRTGGLLSDRRTSALPLWNLTSKNMPYFFFFFPFGYADRTMDFLSIPGEFKMGEHWGSLHSWCFTQCRIQPLADVLGQQKAALPLTPAVVGGGWGLFCLSLFPLYSKCKYIFIQCKGWKYCEWGQVDLQTKKKKKNKKETKAMPQACQGLTLQWL